MINVSVVIPAYNDAARISRTICSILRQTLPVAEIIIVDDGSVDGTQEVIEQYGDAVTYLYQPNQGPSTARNNGIKHAQTEWVAFLDDDDEWLPEHIENANKIIREHPDVQWYCAAFERRKEDGQHLYTRQLDGAYVRDSIIDNYFLVESETCFSRTSSMIVRKRVLEEAGMFNADIIHGEDCDLWYRIALRYPKIAYSKGVGCIYYSREHSITDVKTTDLAKFLRRIDITRTSSQAMCDSPHPESERLMRRWVVDAIKVAIKQNDRSALTEIYQHYFGLLGMRWRITCWLLQNNLMMDFAQILVVARMRLIN